MLFHTLPVLFLLHDTSCFAENRNLKCVQALEKSQSVKSICKEILMHCHKRSAPRPKIRSWLWCSKKKADAQQKEIIKLHEQVEVDKQLFGITSAVLVKTPRLLIIVLNIEDMKQTYSER